MSRVVDSDFFSVGRIRSDNKEIIHRVLGYHSILLRQRRLFNGCSAWTDTAIIFGIECLHKVCMVKIVKMQINFFRLKLKPNLIVCIRKRFLFSRWISVHSHHLTHIILSFYCWSILVRFPCLQIEWYSSPLCFISLWVWTYISQKVRVNFIAVGSGSKYGL